MFTAVCSGPRGCLLLQLSAVPCAFLKASRGVFRAFCGLPKRPRAARTGASSSRRARAARDCRPRSPAGRARARAIAASAGPSGAATRYLLARMVIVIVLFWVLLGLGVFFVAMRGGPRGARQRCTPNRSSASGMVTLGVIVLFAFGLAVPALVLAFNARPQGQRGGRRRAPDRRAAERPRTVRHARARSATRSPRSSRSGGSARTSTCAWASDIATPAGRKALVLNAIIEGRARGLGQMPALLYQGKEAEAVAEFVAAVAGH